jgi:hypothetical protein
VAWREIWDDVLGPLFEGVLKTGEAYWAKDRQFFLERHGFPEETFFDVSYDPVRDESGAVGGIFCIVNETTGRVVGERRLALLRDLARSATARSAREACALAMETIAASPQDIPFALVHLDGRLQATTPGAETALGLAPAAGVHEVPIPGGRLVADSTRSGRSTSSTAASSTWSPARSAPPSPPRRPGRRSAAAPRRWPSSTARRRSSSATSATSSARRSR